MSDSTVVTVEFIALCRSNLRLYPEQVVPYFSRKFAQHNAIFRSGLVLICWSVVDGGGDELVEGIDARLALIENLMPDYANGRSISSATQAGLGQFAMVGAGALSAGTSPAQITLSFFATLPRGIKPESA